MACLLHGKLLPKPVLNYHQSCPASLPLKASSRVRKILGCIAEANYVTSAYNLYQPRKRYAICRSLGEYYQCLRMLKYVILNDRLTDPLLPYTQEALQ